MFTSKRYRLSCEFSSSFGHQISKGNVFGKGGRRPDNVCCPAMYIVHWLHRFITGPEDAALESNAM